MEANVIKGPPGVNIPNISLGKFILDHLQKSPIRISQVDAKSGKFLTNHDILGKSVKLAVALDEWGLNLGETVAISSESQSNWFVAACATMYLGGCVAPLNPAYVEGEIRHCLSISKPKIIFVSKSTEKRIRQVASTLPWKIKLIQLDDKIPGEQILTLDEMISGKRQWPDPYRYQAREVENSSAREVVILYSSGTTGLPKGVMLSHRNMMALMYALDNPEYIQFRDNTVTLFILPFFHGYGYATMLSTICHGATAIVMQSFEPKLFCESIQRYRVTLIPLVPPIMVFLAKHPMISTYDLSSLREIICGAAPLSREVHEAVAKRLGKRIAIRNGYGMTELTVVTNLTPSFTNKIGTVGQLMPGIYCKVIDPKTSRSIGANEIGEVCFKGDHVMLGYKNDPKATSETIDSNNWLHTGDLGYYDTDGHLFVVGRLKELIKYKGFQIAPAEIENLLLAHNDIEDAAVVGKEDEICGEIPVAFVVKKIGCNVSAEEICKFVNDQVSSQKKLRGGVRFIDAIPKNPAGKILRRELMQLFSKL